MARKRRPDAVMIEVKLRSPFRHRPLTRNQKRNPLFTITYVTYSKFAISRFSFL
jgi:hypothetical protein